MSLMKNPSALAGATRAVQFGIRLKTEEYRKRAEAATALCHSIAECEPEDALFVMESVLFQMRAGAPGPVFAAVMQEAKEWADFACEAERKAYCLTCFNSLPAQDRAAFLSHVTGGGHG